MKKEKQKPKRRKISSPTKRKILFLLGAGIALGLSHSPRAHYWIFREVAKEWKKIDRQYLYRVIKEFYRERLVDLEEKPDGSVRIILTEKGKEWVLEYHIDKLEVKKPTYWDGKWRIVFFDVPEKRRQARDALRGKLRDLGFYELQKSVFVYPFPCQDEIDFIVEYFEIRPFVRYAEVTKLTNEEELKLHFNLK